MFHLITVLATLRIARCLQLVHSNVRFTQPDVARWAAPLALALPIFHARFSIATLEYSLALAAVMSAWTVLLKPPSRIREATAIVLLAFAIGVPSLAIVFPVVWGSVSWIHRGRSTSSDFMRKLLRYGYVPAIPLVYSLIFDRLLNTKDKFRVSRDGLIDFGNDLLRLIGLMAVVLVVTHSFWRQMFHHWLRIAVAAGLSYFALFPYFAVGYKPLFDFMPWKMREAVKDVALDRLSIVLPVLVVIAALTVFFMRARNRFSINSFGYLAISTALVFGAATTVFGPMDWDSRHWLVAWPALASLFVAMLGGVGETARRAVAISTFAVLVAASLWISSEYLVDSLKQKAIVGAVQREVLDSRLLDPSPDEYVYVVVDVRTEAQELNARFRKLRPYEWWGLVASGLDISPNRVKLLEREDLGVRRRQSCSIREEGIIMRPQVTSSRWEALSRLNVKVGLEAKKLVLCEPRVEFGWPRDP